METYGDVLYTFKKDIPEKYKHAVPSGGPILTKDFLEFNSMPGHLTEDREMYCFNVWFPPCYSVTVCEDVFITLWYWKPIGILLKTNRTDLFVNEKLYVDEVSKLQSKKYKLEAKLRKVNKKLSDIMEKVNEKDSKH
jgi:hypothetical protein